jgi:serine/threonine-protein kinase RsbT
MERIHLHYDVDGDDFTAAGEASSDMKSVLHKLGFDSEMIRRAAICMYEGEINMVIHASGGFIDVYIGLDSIEITMTDTGPGIKDMDKIWQEGYTTAPETVRNLGFGAGMGIPNMKKYSDYVHIESEVGIGTKVMMLIENRE